MSIQRHRTEELLTAHAVRLRFAKSFDQDERIHRPTPKRIHLKNREICPKELSHHCFHHHATLTIAAHGFLLTERLRSGSHRAKKTPYSAACLPFPRITYRAAARRAQRHVADSLATLRYELSVRLLASLPRCPCCGRSSTTNFMTQ